MTDEIAKKQEEEKVETNGEGGCPSVFLAVLAFLNAPSLLLTAEWLKNRGDSFYKLGDFQSALNAYSSSLEVAKRPKLRR